MIGELPISLNVGGKQYAIRSDYREILNIFQAFNDDSLSKQEKAYICLKCLYVNYDDIPINDLQEAIEKAFWFCDGGDMPKSKPEKVKSFDWDHDQSILFPAINTVAGYEVRTPDKYMHWWTFLGYFGEIRDGLFSTVMNIRNKKLHGKKLDKGEIEFYNHNRNLVDIQTAKDKAEIEETEAFLKELLGE
ncbi:MAG: Gp15 family bacteriophage protein [Oscillospiraceae bacterium]